MFRITRIVPTTVLTVAVLALVAPVAQARPLIERPGGTALANPSVQSTQDFNTYSTQRVHRDAGSGIRVRVPENPSAGWRVHRALGSVVVTTGDTPLANPVQLPSTPVNAPNSGNGFDTAAAIGAALAGILVMLAVGVGFRRRGQLAT
jgi:hypothetical protein